jgi:RNA polymerase sigma-70 factor (ECF subfamily)
MTQDSQDATAEKDVLALETASDRSLLHRFQQGDADAATQLYFRYAHRLRALTREKCPDDLNSRFDPDDIVQSVFRSFFRVAREGLYEVPDGADLWRLLLVIALNKIRTQGAFHRAAKRDVRLTCGIDSDQVLATSRHPDQDAEAVFLQVVADEALERLPEQHRQTARLRLEGYEVAEIAAKVGRSKRTVERLLQECRHKLSTLFNDLHQSPHADPGGCPPDG